MSLRRIDGRAYVRHQAIWYAVELASLPYCARWHGVDYTRTGGLWDVLLKLPVVPGSEAARRAAYAHPALYAVWKQPLGRRALRRLGLWRT